MKTPVKSLSAPGIVTLAAGGNQLVNWGISFYMPGTFASAIAQETGWAATEIYAGLTIAMLMMAMISPFVARLLACFGGQRVVVTGTLMISAGCLIMAYVHSLPGWFAAWLLTGTGMRLALYDALFAALVNIYGSSARLTISRVTLSGGLASALFWPLGTGLLTQMDWRHALLIYALFGLLSAMLLCKMPNHKLPSARRIIQRQRLSGQDKRLALLYASLIALVTFVSNGTSTHLPEFIASFGLPVTVGMLLGDWANRRALSRSGVRFRPHAVAANDTDHATDAALLCARPERALSVVGGWRICVGLRRDQRPDDRI